MYTGCTWESENIAVVGTEKRIKRHPKVTHISHFTPLVFMVQGVGALTSSPCCNYLSASFISSIVFSHPLMRKGAGEGCGVWGCKDIEPSSGGSVC